MSDIKIPGKPDYKPIRLQTRCCHEIENHQVFDFSPSEIAQIPEYKKQFPGVIFRNAPNPIYNCHGFTFASSRTTIGTDSISMILEDDGYAEISDINTVLPGDIVIYYKDTGEITHSGIVVSKPSDDPIKIPWVVSKWGKHGEVLHRAYDCPYNRNYMKYWRIVK
jgi:hypothetical protein